MINFKIKTTITSMFLAFITIISVLTLYFQYKSGYEFALLTTQTKFNNVVDNSTNEIESYGKSSKEFINIVQGIKELDVKIEFDKEHTLLPIITSYIKQAPYVYGIYLGFPDDSFYIVYNVQLSQKMRDELNAPKEAVWLVKKNIPIENELLSKKIFLDEKLNVIDTIEEKTNFRPTTRPWYENAVNSDFIIKTEPYIFDALNSPGITYAKTINKEKGIVLSIDITLDSLNELLSKQKLVDGSSVFMYNKDGKIIGYHNNLTKTAIKNVSENFQDLFIKNGQIQGINTQEIINYKNTEYIRFTKEIDSSSTTLDYLTILSPLKPIMKPYIQKIYDVIYITTILILFIFIPLMLIATKLLSRPITQLTLENSKVQKGDYDKIEHVKSFITEISGLSNSFVKMSQAIKEKSLSNEKLIKIGYQISSEQDYDVLLQSILLGAKELSGADGGTLYIYNEDEKSLEFKSVINSSLNIFLGGEHSKITWNALKMYDEEGNVNRKNISIVSAFEDKLICINDVYNSNEFDFTGVKEFDKTNNYNTKSMLVIPMKDRDGELVGVIQLINKIKDDEVIGFNQMDKKLVESMASLSAMALHNSKLLLELERLLYGLIESVGGALGEKSGYTGKHIDNVAELSTILANAINEDKTIFKDVNFTKEQLEEIRLAAWLHDIGKITTPEYIVDKSTRLEAIWDRINFVEAKIEIAKKDLELAYLNNEISKDEKDKKIKLLEDDIDFISLLNKGGEFMSDENKARLDEILSRDKIIINSKTHEIISEDEYKNLSIKKGTLTDEERDIINNHVLVSYTMLKKVQFPKKFAKVPVLAGSHHKTVEGHGYAHEDIKDLEMTIGDKILAVADIFEALSAHDRPYREPNKLSQIAKILMFMVNDKHIDKDIVRFFLENKVYEEYVKRNFQENQIDEITIDFNDIKYKD